MSNKEKRHLRPYRFFTNPDMDTREPFIQQLLRLYGKQRYQFVGQDEAWRLLDRHRDWLLEQGCKHLLGADGNKVWWIDVRANELFTRHSLEMDLEREDYALGMMSDGEPGAEWFVIKERRNRFQTIRLTLGKRCFRFAVVRNEPSQSALELHAQLRIAGLAPIHKGIFEILHEATSNGRELSLFWTALEDAVGPMSSMCAVDPKTQAYFSGLTPCISPAWGEQTFLEFFLSTSIPGTDAIEAHLIPIA